MTMASLFPYEHLDPTSPFMRELFKVFNQQQKRFSAENIFKTLGCN